jgi:hypothetical protein
MVDACADGLQRESQRRGRPIICAARQDESTTLVGRPPRSGRLAPNHARVPGSAEQMRGGWGAGTSRQSRISDGSIGGLSEESRTPWCTRGTDTCSGAPYDRPRRGQMGVTARLSQCGQRRARVSLGGLASAIAPRGLQIGVRAKSQDAADGRGRARWSLPVAEGNYRVVRSTRVAPPRVCPLGLGSNDRLALPTQKRWPYQVMTFVEWCGHQVKVILVPEGDG